MRIVSATVPLIAALLICSCRSGPDPRQQSEIAALRAEVKQLRERVQDMEREDLALREQLAGQSRDVETLQKSQDQLERATQASSPEVMTLDRMRRELEQPLQEAIRKAKQKFQTAAKGDQFGLRLEYHPEKAVYGLIRKENPEAPYSGKILVPCERFLESASESKSYGESSTEFLFSYSKGKWKLESYKQ